MSKLLHFPMKQKKSPAYCAGDFLYSYYKWVYSSDATSSVSSVSSVSRTSS